ncbi:MAG: type II secretion system F family protein [Oscillatoria sp. PMC 1051.18]|uniref:type II secretion system F family protein n=1 Tax=Oscillatoria salina TaxID=331517 RepID=UPI0013B9E00B|nr:type II secretion system F family protein [Oscillatoria salina]MBZ8179556.1 type II secretion system F family protein [Oscillatoria salina IIICB1]MEC4891448.1 type II secretion system F family protein [Oscillatoria sp. PMC 1050.18]MEC5029596.1 type II secretion system F family protein [Oscillatoria sp. PMC 1051.18]NET89010.1 type II secretion system F family protein [Kamptonema sp. SIO1D9]
MPSTYIVDVVDATGKSSKEKVEANSPEQARSILQGRYPTIGQIKKAGFDIDLSQLEMLLTSITVKDKAVFSRQFAAMINAGVPIVRCLGVLSDQCSNPKLKRALLGISADVQEGTNLSDSMRKHRDCFDQLYISMVEAGEVGGVLDEVLNRLAKLLEDMAKLQSQIKGAMAYPVAVAFIAILVFLGMTIFIIPVFAGIFQDLGTELPALTSFMLATSKAIRNPLLVGITVGTIVAVVVTVKQYYKTPPGRLQIDGLMLKLPLIGDLLEKTAVARFCRIFGTLTRSGVPILTSLEIVRDTAGNQVIANAIESAKQEIQQGGMMSIAIDKEQVFPALAVQMMSIGEETGELDGMMMKVADFYDNEVEETVKALTSLLEPIMIVVVAGMVGVILLSMYLPMFKVFEDLG